MKFEGTAPLNPNQRAPRKKSQERLQAQIEVFADQGVAKFSEDQAQMLRHAARFSGIKDLNNLLPNLPKQPRAFLEKYKRPYINFLRQKGRMETSFVEENIKRYREKFQQVVVALKAKMAQGNFKELPEYLGSGSNGSAFRIEVDGKTYAAKFSGDITQANFEIKPLIQARGIPHTAQLESYSFEDGVVIMGLLPGTDVTKFTPEDALEYSDQDIIQLIETVRDLDARGIVIDPKPSNFMYDTEHGFSILDYHLKNKGSNYGVAQSVMSLKTALSTRKFEQLDYDASDYEEKENAQRIEKNKIFLPLMIRFLGILKEKYPDILAEWQRQYAADKNNPRMSVPELIDRRYIPQHPELDRYLKKLEEMGF